LPSAAPRGDKNSSRVQVRRQPSRSDLLRKSTDGL
jgi:hypothetical protein